MSKFNRLKGTIKAIFNLYRTTSRTGSIPKTSSRAVVHLDTYLLNKDMGRYAFIACQYLTFAGFPVIIKLNTEFFLRPAPFKKMMLRSNFHFIRSADQPVNTIYFYNGRQPRKIISLVYGFQLNSMKDHAAFMPYPLHPNYYKEPLSMRRLSDLRGRKRNIGIFFAGNADRSLYKSDLHIPAFHNISSRVDVLDHLKNTFKGTRVMEIVTEPERLEGLLNGEAAVGKMILSEARTPGDRWLEILSSANFYICLPGMEMPWSHNAIEAMSVGTIPIIQYGHLFSPPLVHLKNSISFNNLHDLKEAVELALRMEGPELATLRQNVCAYFDQFLSPHAVLNNLNTYLQSGQPRLKIRIPYLNSLD